MLPRHWPLLEVSTQPSAKMSVSADFKVVGTLPDYRKTQRKGYSLWKGYQVSSRPQAGYYLPLYTSRVACIGTLTERSYHTWATWFVHPEL